MSYLDSYLVFIIQVVKVFIWEADVTLVYGYDVVKWFVQSGIFYDLLVLIKRF